MHYDQHESLGGVCSTNFKFTAEIQPVVKAAYAAYNRVVEKYDETVALARDRWEHPPRRAASPVAERRRGATVGDRGLSADRTLHFDEGCSIGVGGAGGSYYL